MKKLIGGIVAILVLTIIFTPFQKTEAISYVGHDGSLSNYLEKVEVKPYNNKKDYWSYIVKACATSHTLGVASVVLKSDVDQVVLGVNKSIKKGDCAHYGAVMKAKDGKTLGAELIQKHEAVAKMEQLLKDGKNASPSQKKILMNEFIRLYTVIGLMPKL